jgi:hypothetical protein
VVFLSKHKWARKYGGIGICLGFTGGMKVAISTQDKTVYRKYCRKEPRRSGVLWMEWQLLQGTIIDSGNACPNN